MTVWSNRLEAAPPLTQWQFMKNCLSLGYGTHDSDVRWAFTVWGGLGFAAHRKKRRMRLLTLAEKLASEVGHGDVAPPLRITPDLILIPMAFVEEAERRFGSVGGHLPDVMCPIVEKYDPIKHAGIGPWNDLLRARLFWETPEIRAEHLCANCDGAPDGGHVGDALCARTLEEWTDWEHRPWL